MCECVGGAQTVQGSGIKLHDKIYSTKHEAKRFKPVISPFCKCKVRNLPHILDNQAGVQVHRKNALAVLLFLST